MRIWYIIFLPITRWDLKPRGRGQSKSEPNLQVVKESIGKHSTKVTFSISNLKTDDSSGVVQANVVQAK